MKQKRKRKQLELNGILGIIDIYYFLINFFEIYINLAKIFYDYI